MKLLKTLIRPLETAAVDIGKRIYGIPYVHGVLFVIGRTAKEFFNDDCHIMASAISFYSILSLIPFVMLLFSVIGYVVVHLGAGFSTEEELYAHLEEYIKMAVPFVTKDILMQLKSIALKRQTLGIAGLGALIFTAWSVFSTLELSFSKVFNTKRRRSMVVSNLLFIVFVVTLGLLFLVVHYVTVIGKNLAVGSDLPIGQTVREIFSQYTWLRIGMLFFVITIVFVVVLKYFSKEKVHSRYAFWGGVLFSGLWMLAVQVFGYYLKNFARYSMLYGSLATLVIIVIWIYYSSLVLLLCAEFTDVIQRRFLTNGNKTTPSAAAGNQSAP